MTDVHDPANRHFSRWLSNLRDAQAKVAILRRLTRAHSGLLGDVKSIGDGVSEMRIDVGPGYRLYFVRRGELLILLLCGGDKSSQERDIRLAKQMVKEC